MIKILTPTFAALALSACSTTGEIGLDDSQFAAGDAFGQSVRQNIAAQIVNPTPSTEPAQASGERVAKAVEAYQSDKVEKPRAPGTLSIQTTGQSGGN
jgi:type IV pilus biogenesis protein CpaD/CtpE